MKPKFHIAAVAVASLVVSTVTSFAQAKKPNILVIMGDDIGWYNTSIYNRGDMGYQAPLMGVIRSRIGVRRGQVNRGR